MMLPKLVFGLHSQTGPPAAESELNYRTAFLTAFMAALALGACSDDPSGPAAPELVITTQSLPTITIGEPYRAGVDAEGGDGEYEWDLASGSLPAGLTMTAEDLPDNDLLITGTPTSVQTSTFTVRVRSEDGQSATRQYSLAVGAQMILNAAIPPALNGFTYSVPLRASGGDGESYQWQIVAGELPDGLALSGSRIQGTPQGTDTTTVTFQVTSGNAASVRTFDVAVVANRTGSYDITTFNISDVPDALQPHVDAAVAQWEQVITADLGPVSLSGLPPEPCGPDADGTAVDDVMILINIGPIDGPGKVLGQARPCFIRTSSGLPILGSLTLDSEDLLPLAGSETLTDLISHEIAHVLGFGTLWNHLGLIENAQTDSTRYIGEQAMAEYQTLGGSGKVPLENDLGEGTRDAHWEEDVFRRELMTGFISAVGTANPLSRVTIAAFEDLGYAVDYAAADAFSLGATLRAHAHRAGVVGYDRVLGGPILTIEDR